MSPSSAATGSVGEDRTPGRRAVVMADAKPIYFSQLTTAADREEPQSPPQAAEKTSAEDPEKMKNRVDSIQPAAEADESGTKMNGLDAVQVAPLAAEETSDVETDETTTTAADRVAATAASHVDRLTAVVPFIDDPGNVERCSGNEQRRFLSTSFSVGHSMTSHRPRHQLPAVVGFGRSKSDLGRRRVQQLLVEITDIDAVDDDDESGGRRGTDGSGDPGVVAGDRPFSRDRPTPPPLSTSTPIASGSPVLNDGAKWGGSAAESQRQHPLLSAVRPPEVTATRLTEVGRTPVLATPSSSGTVKRVSLPCKTDAKPENVSDDLEEDTSERGGDDVNVVVTDRQALSPEDLELRLENAKPENTHDNNNDEKNVDGQVTMTHAASRQTPVVSCRRPELEHNLTDAQTVTATVHREDPGAIKPQPLKLSDADYVVLRNSISNSHGGVQVLPFPNPDSAFPSRPHSYNAIGSTVDGPCVPPSSSSTRQYFVPDSRPLSSPGALNRRPGPDLFPKPSLTSQRVTFSQHQPLTSPIGSFIVSSRSTVDKSVPVFSQAAGGRDGVNPAASQTSPSNPAVAVDASNAAAARQRLDHSLSSPSSSTGVPSTELNGPVADASRARLGQTGSDSGSKVTVVGDGCAAGRKTEPEITWLIDDLIVSKS